MRITQTLQPSLTVLSRPSIWNLPSLLLIKIAIASSFLDLWFCVSWMEEWEICTFGQSEHCEVIPSGWVTYVLPCTLWRVIWLDVFMWISGNGMNWYSLLAFPNMKETSLFRKASDILFCDYKMLLLLKKHLNWFNIRKTIVLEQTFQRHSLEWPLAISLGGSNRSSNSHAIQLQRVRMVLHFLINY